MKKGLILEGGAMRGLFSAGVMDVLMENSITFDGAIGVSAGAAFGCNYKSGQIGRALRYNKKFCTDSRYCSWKSFFTTGDLYGAKFCYHTLPMELDVFDARKFEQNPMEFYVTCTDVNTGKAVYKKMEDVSYESLEWMRASASMPLVSSIVKLEGRELLDGGMADSIPLKFFESLGYEKNIVILTQPQNYVKHKNRLLPLIRLLMRKYPQMIRTLENRHLVYNETLAYIKKRIEEKAVLVIQPQEPLQIGAMERDPLELQRVYDRGRFAAKNAIAYVKDFLK